MEHEKRIREIARLRKRLADLRREGAALESRTQELAASIPDVRQRLGNPFFYSGGGHGRPGNATQTIAKYTGYKSHEPALALLQERVRNATEIKTVDDQLRALTIEPAT